MIYKLLRQPVYCMLLLFSHVVFVCRIIKILHCLLHYMYIYLSNLKIMQVITNIDDIHVQLYMQPYVVGWYIYV